ncbi:Nectarin-2 [Dactylella cylindrospora]|nr:Nectarin-2 [Dactylella cylindrospora]
MRTTLLAAASALLFSEALGCPEHNHNKLRKRAGPTDVKWTYEASYDWGRLSDDFALCQIGTQQSPIPLQLSGGLSQSHHPTFNYSTAVPGSLHNWGYGPAVTLSHPEGDYTTLPSFTFEESPGQLETVYLSGWHLHAPADHSVGGDKSKAELHYVHVNATGSPRAVLAFRIDPGNTHSSFFSHLPPLVRFNDNRTTTEMEDFNPTLALEEVNFFHEFWTYKGSLTSPPCTEGIRWWVARNILFVGVKQMQDILWNSVYSARAEQEVWLHQVNV